MIIFCSFLFNRIKTKVQKKSGKGDESWNTEGFGWPLAAKLTSSSCAVKCGPVVLLRAMMMATMSLPLRMGAARTLRVVNSVSSSTNELKYWLCKDRTGPRSH